MTLGGMFLDPAPAPFLLAAPLAAALLLRLDLRRRRRLRELTGPRTDVLASEVATGARRARRWLAAIAIVPLVLAFMQPLGGDARGFSAGRGLDIVVALDVSRSMLARDAAPSRLAAAKREIGTLLARSGADRFALVLFAGEARLAAPLTEDTGAVLALTSEAGPESVSLGGSDPAAALATAAAALIDPDGRHAAVILLTDGEDPDGRGARAAEDLRRRGVVVHCLGFGSDRGSKIPVEGEGGEIWLRDSQGREVVTAMDPASLGRVAEATGGVFVEAAARQDPVLWLYDRQIRPRARRSLAASEEGSRENLFQWPLLLAILLLLAEFCLAERARS